MDRFVRFIERVVEDGHLDLHRADASFELNCLGHAGVIVPVLGAAVLRREIKGDAAGLAIRAGDDDNRERCLFLHGEALDLEVQFAAQIVIDEGDDCFGEVAELAAGRVAQLDAEGLLVLHLAIADDADGERAAGDARAEGDGAVGADEVHIRIGAAAGRGVIDGARAGGRPGAGDGEDDGG